MFYEGKIQKNQGLDCKPDATRLPRTVLETYHKTAGDLRAGVFELSDDTVCQELATCAPDSCFTFVFQQLRVLMVIDSELIFEKITVQWTLRGPKDGWYHLPTLAVPLLKQSTDLLIFPRFLQ